MIVANLPSTAAHSFRSYAWTASAGPADPTDGLLTVGVSGGAVETYGVTEVAPIGGRVFVLAKSSEPVGYQTTVGRAPALDRCTCRAGRYGKRCKHADALRSLIEAGHLEHPAAR